MPRKSDPELEHRIAMAALRLLDRGGTAAITMRSVAREARTTTPTIYERFPDRERLMDALVVIAVDEVLRELRPTRSVERFVRGFLRFSGEHQHRFDLMINTFGSRLTASHPTPVFSLFKDRLAQETGLRGGKLEDLALAVTALVLGTARGMIATGMDTHAAADLRRSCLAALRLLLGAFSTANGS